MFIFLSVVVALSELSRLLVIGICQLPVARLGLVAANDIVSSKQMVWSIPAKAVSSGGVMVVRVSVSLLKLGHISVDKVHIKVLSPSCRF